MEGGITAQTRQSLTNVKAVVEAAGLTMDHVAKTTVFLQMCIRDRLKRFMRLREKIDAIESPLPQLQWRRSFPAGA